MVTILSPTELNARSILHDRNDSSRRLNPGRTRLFCRGGWRTSVSWTTAIRRVAKPAVAQLRRNDRLAETVSRPADPKQQGFKSHRDITLHLRSWHAPLPAQDPRQLSCRNCFHSGTATRHHLRLVPIRLPAAMHLLPHGPTRLVAVVECRRDCRADRDRSQRRLWRWCKTSTRNQPGGHGCRR